MRKYLWDNNLWPSKLLSKLLSNWMAWTAAAPRILSGKLGSDGALECSRPATDDDRRDADVQHRQRKVERSEASK